MSCRWKRRREQKEHRAEESLLRRAVRRLGEDDEKLYCRLQEAAASWPPEALQDARVPSGKGTYSIWIAGGGRILLSLKTEEQTVTLVSVRSGEKEAYSWDDVAAAKDAVMHTVLSVGKGWKKTSGGNWEAEADGISEFRVNGTEEEKNRAGREQAGKEMRQTKAELRKPGKEALQGAAKPQKKES